MAEYTIDKIKYGDNIYKLVDNTSGYGTITGITMNGASMGTTGVVDLGTVITSHQSISGKADKSATVSTITWDTTNNKLTKTINGSTTDVVTLSTIKTALGSMPASDVSSWAKASTKPSYTFSEIGSKPTTISGYGITDAYTKTEVDGLVSGVFHYKGTKAAVANLPSADNATGDVWHVTANAGEYAWDGSEWQELGSTVDLSGYVPTSRKVNNKALTGDITLSASDVGAATSGHTHTTTLAADTGTSTITLEHGGKYKLTAGGTTVIFTMPAAGSVPTSAGSATTGISIADHATTAIYGVKSGTNSTTTASKASGDNGTAANWVFEEVSIPNVTSAGTASSWTFESKTVATGLTFAIDSSDSNQLNITNATTTVYSKSGGSNGTAPTLGTAKTVQSKKSGSNGSASTWSFTDVTVPIRADSATTVVTGKTHSITDNGHTHTLS